MDLQTRLVSIARRVPRASLLVVLASLVVVGGTGTTSPVREIAVGSSQSKRAPAHVSAPSPEPGAVKPVAAIEAVSLASRAHTVLFGAWVKPRGSETHQQAVTRMEAEIGRRFSIDHVYHGWNGPLIGSYERWSASRGHTLLINWKAAYDNANGESNGAGGGYVRWADIAAGKYDADIAARAREIKRFKKIVYLNFHHEPEDDQDTPGQRKAGTPADYRAAWRHIRAIFRSQHVTNVRFVFILMGWTYRSGHAAQWYPGSRVIDIVGADAYNWFGTAHPGSHGWTTFASAFHAAQQFAAAKGKTFWVAETGAMEDRSRPSRRPEWYRAIAGQVRSWGNVGAVVFFMGGRYGWYPDSSGRSLAAFNALAHDTLFK